MKQKTKVPLLRGTFGPRINDNAVARSTPALILLSNIIHFEEMAGAETIQDEYGTSYYTIK